MSDIPVDVCRAPDKADEGLPTLPRLARLPINRCNLPADILGGLTYQRHPTPLQIDGVADLHKPLWALLDDIPGAVVRAEGKLNGGGPRVSISASSGTIHLRKGPPA